MEDFCNYSYGRSSDICDNFNAISLNSIPWITVILVYRLTKYCIYDIMTNRPLRDMELSSTFELFPL
jgi:hypothetical protein